jgi:di/tripeptidase
MISKATIIDVPELNALVNSAYRGDSSKQGWTTEADLLGGIRTDEDGLSELMQQPGSFILKYVT